MYYKLGDKRYGNKLEALIAAKEKTGDANNIEYVPHTDWDSYDWLNEPEESWQEILRQHALELRQKYSYLRLWYSGGVDSQTIINTFVKNNIHLDEIVLCRDSPIDRFDTFDNGEINWVAIPYLKDHKDAFTRTKITIIDIGSEDCYNLWSNESLFIENQTNLDYSVTFGMINTYKDEVKPNSIQSQKNAANIHGMEKPIIGLDEHGFYMYYIDTLTPWQSKHDPTTSDEALEAFFLSPKVWSKQCHMMKNFCKEKKENYLQFLVNGERLPLLTTDSVCRDPLYLPFSIGKNINVKKYHENSLSSRCGKCLFRENLTINSGSPLIDMNFYMWSRIEEIIKSKIGKNWLNNKENIKDGITGKLSKKYYLEHDYNFYNEAISYSTDEVEFRNALSEFNNSFQQLPKSNTLIMPEDRLNSSSEKAKPPK